MEKEIVKKGPPYTPYELFGNELAGSGWSGLVSPIIDGINKYNKDKPDNEKAHISQIKEKWAGACIYLYAPEKFQRMSEIAEKASYRICYECGSVFNVGQTEHGWITTLCENCAKEQGKYDDWKPRFTSVELDGFLKIYLKVRSKFKKFLRKLDDLHYKYFRRWKYRRTKTFNIFKALIFWKYELYKKYDFIPVELREPDFGVEYYFRSTNKNWPNHYKAIYIDNGVWNVTYPLDWNSETDGIINEYKKIKPVVDTTNGTKRWLKKIV